MRTTLRDQQIPLVEVDPAVKLTPQQTLVLEQLKRAEADGLHADEAGAWAHSIMESKWRHSPEERCLFCTKRGLQILHRLREHGLARYRAKSKVWQAIGHESDSTQPVRSAISEEEEFGY